MHHAFDRAERVVADRIGAFLRALLELARIGHELPRDRIVRIVRSIRSAIAGVMATA